MPCKQERGSACSRSAGQTGAAAGSLCAQSVWLQQHLNPGFIPGAHIPWDISGLLLHPCVYVLPELPDCLTACQGLLRISEETRQVQSGIARPSSSRCVCMLNRAVIAVAEYKHLGLEKCCRSSCAASGDLTLFGK